MPDSSVPTRPPRLHLAYLDGLRALAALFVVVHHMFLQVDSNRSSLPSGFLNKLIQVLVSGQYAVDVFIVLSGFCLAFPVFRGNGEIAGGAAWFYRKRAHRILPPYFLAFGLSLLLIGTLIGEKTGRLWDVAIPVTGVDLLTHVLLIQDMFPVTNHKINPAFWSISVEWRIYFLFPLLVVLARRAGMVLVALGCTIAGYAFLHVGQHSWLNNVLNFEPTGLMPHYLGLFAVGMLAAEVAYGRTTRFTSLRRRGPALILLAITSVVVLVATKLSRGPEAILHVAYADLAVGLWTAALLIAAAIPELSWVNRPLSWRPLVFVGTFAYSLYLIHMPLIQILWQYPLRPWQGSVDRMFLGLCGLGLPMIVGCAYLFYLVCERPFLNRSPKRVGTVSEKEQAIPPIRTSSPQPTP